MSRQKAKGGKAQKVPGPGQRAGKDQRSKHESTGEEAHLQWHRNNYLLLGIGGFLLVIGFLLLAVGDTTIAPILLVGGYLVLIPWGIVASRKGDPTTGPGKPS